VNAPPFLLAARGVARAYGAQQALRPAEVEVLPGEALALVGPNGAGKSTLLAILADALQPTSGEVERAPGVRVGWVPQRAAHYGRLTARENLELFARLDGVDDAAGVASRLLGDFHLPDDGRAASALSVGNRQRLDVALALIGDPDVLLLDEPTASLDPQQRRRLWASALALRERGGSVVFATQNLDELERVADRVVVLLDGDIVFAGSYGEYEASETADVFV
jgi:ABC-type multidrug transport system ATPase subunit